MIRNLNPEHDYSSLILNGLKSDEECQRVIDYLLANPNAGFYDVMGFSFSIEKERYELEHKNEEYISPYESAVKSFFDRRFHSYADLSIERLELSFQIRSATKNTPLIYTILELLPEYTYSIKVNQVQITLETEKDIVKQLELISDLLTLIKKWKSTKLIVNDTTIEASNEFNYIVYFLQRKFNESGWYQTNNIKYLEKKYYPKKRKKSLIEFPDEINYLSKTNLSDSLMTVVNKYIELLSNNLSVDCYEINQNNQVIVIENDFVVDFRLIPKAFSLEENDEEDWKHPVIVIQELTHNGLFKFNWAGFKRNFGGFEVGLDYLKYHGVDYYRKEVDNTEIVDNALPELELAKRLQDYSGDQYHVVILKMEDADGNYSYGIGYTKNEISKFISKLCKEMQEKGSGTIKHGISCLPSYGNLNRKFINAFLSWTGKSKIWRIENKFSYYYEDVFIKNDSDLWDLPKKYLQKANTGAYSEAEFGTYHKPVNKWKSEELVYKITQKLYREYQVIYQYKPYFLATEYGNMSYDVYICGLKIAIEYQGKQHFEPVGYFGGEENHIKQKKRDELKSQRSKENGIKLVYVYYWDDISPELIKERIDEAISMTP